MVPERARIFPELTVFENLRMGVYKQRVDFSSVSRSSTRSFRLWRSDRPSSAPPFREEQQQLAIARALVSGPKLLLVDEVSMGLMPKLVSEVFSVLQSLNRDEGLTILLVEQSALLSLEISHRAYVLETGEIRLEGAASTSRTTRGCRKPISACSGSADKCLRKPAKRLPQGAVLFQEVFSV